MASEKIKSAKLKLVLNNGTDENGEVKTLSKTLANINAEVEIAALHNAATKIASFTTTPLHKLYKVTETEITE